MGQSSPARKWAGTAMPTIVSGMASPSARPDSRHASRSAGRQARWPSVNSTVNSAMSANAATNGLSEGMSTTPNPPWPSNAPAARNSSAVDRMVLAASPDSDTLISSTIPNASTSATGHPSPRPRTAGSGDGASRVRATETGRGGWVGPHRELLTAWTPPSP